MKFISLTIGVALAGLLIVGCDSGKSGDEAKKEGGVAGAETALMAPAASSGRMDNDEGVGHYQQGHWDVAEGHFRKAVKADANLAEAHFNLALSLDKMGKHEEATASFKKAAELAPNNPKIKESVVLKKHTGM
jgi:Flp pilus assembly protein TadD